MYRGPKAWSSHVMRVRLPFFVLLSIPLSIAACGDVSVEPSGAGGNGAGGSGAGGAGAAGGSGGAGAAPSGLPCDVEQVLVENCQMCHSAKPKFGAPMPLVTHADLHAPLKSDASKKVYEQVGVRIHDTKNPMPEPPNEMLDAEQAGVLDAWIANGAPASADDCGGTGGSGGGTGGAGAGVPLSCTPDVKLQPATPWVMPKETEDVYVCYGVDLDLGDKRHVTALAPLIDNATIVHHMLLFSASSSYGSTPKPCGGANMGQLVGVWAPGGQALELPPEAGYPLEGTAHFVLQIHYSNLMALDGEKDSSGYQLCTTTELRPNDADILAFGSFNFDIPAQSSVDITCDLKLPSFTPTLHGIAGMPHMHKLGTHMSTTVLPAGGGAAIDLGTAEPWNFESQVWTMLGESTVVKPGDLVRARCAWDNPTNENVGFGEDTSDEMCFGFLMYYPRIETPGWQWGAPAYASSCSPTP